MKANKLYRTISTILLCTFTLAHADKEPKSISGIYPHLAMYNDEGECGTGAVVPWAGKLWMITYGPHLPNGSSDKLYSVDADLNQTVHEESVGGTPANRMIHDESQQLFIGPYAIAADGTIRVILPSEMSGRLTGTARHLTDPENKIYIATMEEGLYEVDVNTLKVKEYIVDANTKLAEKPDALRSALPGYHGKGLYTGQGRLVYSNNGEYSPLAMEVPSIPSGALAEWYGEGDWQLVRRNQFTEVSGPGGIHGNEDPETDPIWAVGWDYRSLILMLLEDGEWHAYRMPKSSHSYDGAHGWNTEWPRIRDIGEEDMLMTMHGAFWAFPKDFGSKSSNGIQMRSNYLKVIGDFSRWGDHIVFGCDDSAKNEFLNKRLLKSESDGPGQSNSNLWFVKPNQIDQLGPNIGRGSVWLNTDLEAGEVSDPYLFSGFDIRMLVLTHDSEEAVDFTIEIDREGNGEWTSYREINVPDSKSEFITFSEDEKGSWVRLIINQSAKNVTAHFNYRDKDRRSEQVDAIFEGVATLETEHSVRGIVRSLPDNRRTMGLVVVNAKTGKAGNAYELDANLNLMQTDNSTLRDIVLEAAPRTNVYTVDDASVLLVEDGVHYRLPFGSTTEAPVSTGYNVARICREVATERDLFNCQGTFYELPARNAQGVAKIRPIATHDLDIQDYCSYRGLLILSGISESALKQHNEHIIVSDNKKAALWAGTIDDLWKLGKPVGTGGPWKNSSVTANTPSDQFLMSGYDEKTLTLSHNSDSTVSVSIELDVDGTGVWVPYRTLEVTSGKTLEYAFPEAISAYWVRLTADKDCQATGWFEYR